MFFCAAGVGQMESAAEVYITMGQMESGSKEM